MINSDHYLKEIQEYYLNEETRNLIDKINKNDIKYFEELFKNCDENYLDKINKKIFYSNAGYLFNDLDNEYYSYFQTLFVGVYYNIPNNINNNQIILLCKQHIKLVEKYKFELKKMKEYNLLGYYYYRWIGNYRLSNYYYKKSKNKDIKFIERYCWNNIMYKYIYYVKKYIWILNIYNDRMINECHLYKYDKKYYIEKCDWNKKIEFMKIFNMILRKK